MHMVTGAFGYSGRYIARRLLDMGMEVRTLTSAAQSRSPFGHLVKALPWSFDDPARLAESLRGTDVLYNTYWVRFNHARFKHAEAVENTLKLFDAAQKAGVRRVVHVSITNPDEHSTLEYFRGKGRLEQALRQSGLSYAILRPTVLFGKEDILINNIAWMLRRFPIFGVFGDGSYRIQPIYVDDLASIAIREGEARNNCVIDAIGPETFTYRELIETIGRIIGYRRPIIRVSPGIGYMIARFLGALVGDVVITREEIQGLMDGLLYTDSPPAGETKLTDWAGKHASDLGVRYASELARR